MDSLVTHTFPETRTRRVLENEFGDVAILREDESKFFKRLIIQNEIWVYHYDPETKAQAMQWKHLDSPPPKKAALHRQGHAHSLLEPRRSSDDRFPGKMYHNYRSLLRFTFDEIKRSYQNQEAGQNQQRYPPPAGQCSGPKLVCRMIRSNIQCQSKGV